VRVRHRIGGAHDAGEARHVAQLLAHLVVHVAQQLGVGVKHAGARIVPSGSMTQRYSDSRRTPCRFKCGLLGSDVDDALCRPRSIQPFATASSVSVAPLTSTAGACRSTSTLSPRATASSRSPSMRTSNAEKQHAPRGHLIDERVEPFEQQYFQVRRLALHPPPRVPDAPRPDP